MMINLTHKELLILQAIGKYKFLTYDQLIRLGIAADKGNISRSVKKLRDRRKPLLRKIPGGFGIADKHYLTSLGAKLIENAEGLKHEIHSIDKIITTDTQDQKHRMSTIDIEIALDLHCNDNRLDTDLIERYFDTVGDNRVSKSLKSKTAFLYDKKSSIKADLITIRTLSANQKEMFVFELENGRDTKKAIEKIKNHRDAILMKSANQKYQFDQGYRTLWIFEHEGTMNAVLDKLEGNSDFQRLEEFFLFQTLEKALDDIYSGWFNLAKKERKLYYRYS